MKEEVKMTESLYKQYKELEDKTFNYIDELEKRIKQLRKNANYLV